MKILRNRFVLNIFSLSSVHFLNYLFPLITVPYIVRVIGTSNYGLINFVQAVVNYFVLIVSFGMSLTAPRDIAMVRDDKNKVSEIFSIIFFSRLYLSFLVSAIFLILVFVIEKLRVNYFLFVISVAYIIQASISSYHFFRGIEKMEYLAILNFISKILFTIMIFIFVRSSNDYFKIIIIDIISSMSVTLFSLYFVICKFDVKLFIPRVKDVITSYKRNISVFLSEIYVLIYTSSYTVILGFISDYSYVGYFTAALKLINVWLGFENNVVSVFFPHISNTARVYFDGVSDKIKKIFSLCLWMSVPATFFFIFYADNVVNFFFGKDYLESVNVLRILSLLNILILLNVHLTFNGMLALGDNKSFNLARLYGAITALIVGPVLIYPYNHIGASLSYVISEIFVLIYSVKKMKNIGIDFLDFSVLKNVFLYVILNVFNFLFIIKVSKILSFVLYVIVTLIMIYLFFNMVGLKVYLKGGGNE